MKNRDPLIQLLIDHDALMGKIVDKLTDEQRLDLYEDKITFTQAQLSRWWDRLEGLRLGGVEVKK